MVSPPYLFEASGTLRVEQVRESEAEGLGVREGAHPRVWSEERSVVNPFTSSLTLTNTLAGIAGIAF